MASASCKHFVSTDPVVWAEAQPRSEVCLGFPSTHVQSHFTYERLSDHHIDAIDPGQIHSRDALELIGEMEMRIIFVFPSFSGVVLPSLVAGRYRQRQSGVSVIPGRTRRPGAGRCHTSRFPVAARRSAPGASCLPNSWQFLRGWPESVDD